MKLNVSLTVSQVREVMKVFHDESNAPQIEREIHNAAKLTLMKHNDKVRAAENLLARVRDSEE